MSAWEVWGWRALLTVCSLFPTTLLQKCGLPLLQSPDGSLGATGLLCPCGRLTSHKQDKAQDSSHTPRPSRDQQGMLQVTRAESNTGAIQGLLPSIPQYSMEN